MSPKIKKETAMMSTPIKGLNCFGAVVPPVFQNSLFTFDSWEAIDRAFDDRTGGYIYSRINNPTTRVVEEKIAELAGGEDARLFGSGMAAVSAAVIHFLKPGDHVVTIKNIYGPANNFFNNYLAEKMDITTTFVEGKTVSDFEKAISSKTRLIYLESPSSAVFSLQDIPAVVNLAKSRGIKTVIDNTWATPVFQKPLGMGVDLELHSCSKYLSGHSDVVGGVVIGSKKEIKELTIKEGELLGGIMSPHDASMILRSLRTIHIRLRKHQESAFKVANYLESHPDVLQVFYPGLKSFPQYDLGRRLMTGYTGLLSFTLKSGEFDQIKRFFNSLKIFQIGVSWGGHESLIYAPAISYLKELPPERFEEMGISPGDMRISVGLEDPDDLIGDLEQALLKIQSA